MEHFTPGSAALGGALIGLSAAMLWLTAGRVAGISGIVGRLWNARPGDVAWRLAFVLGLVAAPLLYHLAGGSLPVVALPQSAPRLIAAGILVGFGTRLASGCTSGHGVCGVARLSPRSLAATGVFMATALITVFVTHHLIGA